MELKGAVALVTGGATGIGRAVAEGLALEGAAAVIVNYRTSAAAAVETVAHLEALGCRGVAAQADVGDESAIKEVIDAAVRENGRLDVLVNSAGITEFIPHGELDALTDEIWEKILRVNLMGTFYASRAAASALRKTGGTIVNIASVAGHRASGSSIPYAVSKAAVLQLTRAMALALAPQIRVNAVSPGLVTTRWYGDHLGQDEATAAAIANAAKQPLGRVATAADVAETVLGFLRSDLVTGQTLIVDGGKHLVY